MLILGDVDVKEITVEDGVAEVIVEPSAFAKAKEVLADNGITEFEAAEVTMKANDPITLEGEELTKFQELLDMLVFDAVILNEDRHFGNFGFLIDNKSNKIVGCAPIFDNGLSLLCYAMDDDFKNINQYIQTRLPATYQDFIAFVKPRMTKRQKEKLRKLIGFKFESHYKYRLPRKRLKYLEEIIQIRVLELLE